MISGIHRVIDGQELLNQINVFPVPDGDTGTNLSLSLGAALPVLQQNEQKHLGTLLAAVADALLDGARGNSGAIMAQFFQGMSDAAADLSRFTPHTFAKAVVTGSDYAHDAMSNPREGTILSVIAAFAASVDDQSRGAADGGFPALIGAALEESRQALAATQEQLEVLRKAGVVDAGAKGFVELVDGMSEYLSTGNIVAEPDLSMLSIDEPLVTVGSSLESGYRFCTECIVTGTDIDRRKLREALADLGDSLVLAGTKRKAKVHIHVDEPERVFDVARRYGHVSAEKADDMRRQQTSSHDASRRFAVITDSAADIPDEDMERLDIHMVPCRVQFGQRGYLDKVSITANEFFAELRSNPNHPTTSQPAPGDFRRQYQFLASHFADVLSINLTGMVSGTVEAARAAAERVNAHGRIHVINSRNASLGQGLLVVAAAEYAKAGLSVQDAIAAVQKLIPDTRTYGLLKDLRFAVRGGRVPRWVKTIAELLRATAIIRTVPDGRVASGTFLFGRKNRVRRFARYVARNTPGRRGAGRRHRARGMPRRRGGTGARIARPVRQHSPHHDYRYRRGARRARRTRHADRGDPALYAPDGRQAVQLTLQHLAIGLDQVVALVAGVVDTPVHGPGPEARAIPARGRDQLVVTGEPAVGAVGIEDHGHAVMQRGEEVVRLRGHQRRGLQRLVRRLAAPVLPEPGEGERLLAGERNEIRDLHVALAVPLVEAVRQHQAAAAAVGGAVRRLFGNRLGPRVDHLVADGRVLGPGRHEPPAQRHQFPAPALGIANRGDVLCRGDVVARPEIERTGRAEQRRGCLGRGIERETAAHGYSRMPMPRFMRYRQPANSSSTNATRMT